MNGYLLKAIILVFVLSPMRTALDGFFPPRFHRNKGTPTRLGPVLLVNKKGRVWQGKKIPLFGKMARKFRSNFLP